MGRRSIVFLMSIFVMLMACTTWTRLTMSSEVPRMTKEELKAMLDNPNLVIIDVRAGTDWLRSDMRIKGAVREDYSDVRSWATRYSKDGPILLYCA